MKITKLNKILVLISVTSGIAALGCELIVDFDRTRIPVETTEGGAEAGATDASNDAPTTPDAEAGTNETGDAGSDADAGITDAPSDG